MFKYKTKHKVLMFTSLTQPWNWKFTIKGKQTQYSQINISLMWQMILFWWNWITVHSVNTVLAALVQALSDSGRMYGGLLHGRAISPSIFSIWTTMSFELPLAQIYHLGVNSNLSSFLICLWRWMYFSASIWA